MHKKVLFETFTRGHSESKRILLNCVLVQCFNSIIKIRWTSGDKLVDSMKLSVALATIPACYSRCNTHYNFRSGITPVEETIWKTRNVRKIGFRIKMN